MKIVSGLTAILLLAASAGANAAPPAKEPAEAPAAPCAQEGRYCASFRFTTDQEARAGAEAEQWDYDGEGALLVLPLFPAPVVRGGRLVAYCFIRPRLVFGGRSDILRVDDNRLDAMDAFVRVAHRYPVVETAPGEVDWTALQEAWRSAAQAAYPEENILDVHMIGGDIRYLRP